MPLMILFDPKESFVLISLLEVCQESWDQEGGYLEDVLGFDQSRVILYVIDDLV